MILPTLYHKSKTGKIVEVKIWVKGNTVFTEHGQIDGKRILSTFQCTGKNIGRSNETTPEEQAILEAKSKHKKKLDQKYALTIEEAMKPVLLPMLAGKKLENVQNKLTYPVHVQPKYDGVRCLAYLKDGEVELLSRGGKPWNVPHIKEQMARLLRKFPNLIFDGELYVHGQTFQYTTRLVKKNRPESKEVKFYIYDIFHMGDLQAQWDQRYYLLFNDIKPELNWDAYCSDLVTSHTYTANSLEDIHRFHKKFVSQGYEGAIVRTLDAPYELANRSSGLIKVKAFMDYEYEITGFCHGKGKFEKSVIWICRLPEHQCPEGFVHHFKVVPKGTIAQKEEWYLNAKQFIGKKLKVEFFELSEDRIPRFPVGIGIRDPADM